MKPPAVIHFPPFRLDLVAGQLYRNDLAVPLQPKTWTMLCHRHIPDVRASVFLARGADERRSS